MDSIMFEFKTRSEAKDFIKQVKKFAKINKFITIRELYWEYRKVSGVVKPYSPDDSNYGWPYRLLSGVYAIHKDTKSEVYMPTFIKKRSK